MMNLITDNLTRTSGKILLDGVDVLELGSKFRSQVGYMPQQQGFYNRFSGRMFLKYMAEMKEIPRKQAAEEIEHVLTLVNLKEAAGRRIDGYSGGMKQRLLLAQALLGNPKILLLDEPTAGLDPEERIRLRNYIHELAGERIVLLATHIVSDVETIADQVILIKNGHLAVSGTPKELMAKVEPYVKEPVTGRLSLEDVYIYYDAQGSKA